MAGERRIVKIRELAAGAEAANQHCVFEANMMNGFVKGLNAALEILDAENDNIADDVAVKYRDIMASITGATQEYWEVEG